MQRLLVLFLFVFFASPLYASPQARVLSEEIDLGSLTEGQIYNHSVSVKNTGDTDLIISAQRVSCGCVRIIEPSAEKTLKPTDSADIKFSFDSTGMFGEVEKFIYVTTNDPARKVIRILVTADIQRQDDVLIDRFKSFRTGTIVSAGLIDGVNPCAFTVLVFFLSFLSFVGYNRKQIFILGCFFILAVFLAYLAIGFGLFEFFRKLEVFRLLSKMIFYTTAILAFVLGCFSLYDWWIFKKTNDPEKIKLKLPTLVKKQIQGIIREKADDRNSEADNKRSIFKLIITALSCGFIVSILESVCTGQLYLPTIIFVLSVPDFKAKALVYLLLYNLMFIFPLLIVFGFAMAGVSSQGFVKITRMHLGKVKLLTALVFFILAFGLLFLLKG